MLGPLPVVKVPGLNSTEELMGDVDYEKRVVRLNVGSPEIELQTYWHESAHVALWDGGAHQQLSDKQREIVCDAIGTYLAAAMQSGFITFARPRKPRAKPPSAETAPVGQN